MAEETTTSERTKDESSGYVKPALIVAGVLAFGGVTAFLLAAGGGQGFAGPTAEVRRGDMTITATEGGTLRSRDMEIVSSQVDGNNSIIWIIEEGAMVEEGDLLVELDASEWEDRVVEERLEANNADAAHIRAQQELLVTRSQAESDIAEAELEARFARLDLEMYLGEEGEYAQTRDELRSEIEIAQEELTRAQKEFEDSESLADRGFITPLELEGDRIARERAAVELRLARGELQLLEQYTHERRIQELEGAVQQAEENLERVQIQAQSDIVQAEADERAAALRLEQERDFLAHVEEQLENCTIRAPGPGMVVYETTANPNRWGNDEPLREGEEVREREELIYLPASDGMIADVTVHESTLDRIETGMLAVIEVDAVPGRIYEGTVRRIAPMPDAQSIWMNPDLTEYKIEIEVDASNLRTGMTCRAEIVIEELEDVLYAPLEVVVRSGGQHYVYVLTERGPEVRMVEIGLDDNKNVHIREGLEAGEVLLTNPPIPENANEPVEWAGTTGGA